MTERTYTLEQITGIMGRHYQASLRGGGSNPERVLRLFTDRVIEDLKREAEKHIVPRT